MDFTTSTQVIVFSLFLLFFALLFILLLRLSVCDSVSVCPFAAVMVNKDLCTTASGPIQDDSTDSAISVTRQRVWLITTTETETMRWKLTDISRISVVVHVSDHLFDGKLQLTECQFPAYSVLRPIRIGGGGRFVNIYPNYTPGKTFIICLHFIEVP